MRRLLTTPFRLVAIATLVGAVLAAANSTAGAGAATCFGLQPTIYATPGVVTRGTAGADVIMGTSGPDVIRALGGADRVCSKGGADTVYGGGGPDQIDLGGGNDVGRGGGGDDRILGRTGADRLFGNGRHDVLIGGAGADVLAGGKGNDEISGNGAADELDGGGGSDMLDGGGRADAIRGGTGADELYGRSGSDTLDGQKGTDSCVGGKGNDAKVSCELPNKSTSGDGDGGGGGGGGGGGSTGPLADLEKTVNDDVLGVFGSGYPWLGQAWNHLNAVGTVEVKDLPGSFSGQVYSSCSYSSHSLGSCDGLVMTIDPDHTGSVGTIIHELGHVFERSTGILADPGPLGMAQLYFNVEWGDLCPPAEIFADTILHVTKPNAWLAYYSGGCPALASVTSEPTAEAEAVITSMLAGNDPAWFSATYANGTQAWAAVMSLPTGERLRVVTNLAGEFGGYCNINNTMMTAFWGGGDPNPWADDGC